MLYYENEIAEKNRKINLLLTANKQITYSSKSREYNQPKLFKEDFYLLCEEDELTYDWESLQTDETTIEMHLKYCESNNHRYCLIKDINNLPIKDIEEKNLEEI